MAELLEINGVKKSKCNFDITIDGILVKVTNATLTIYEVAKLAGINISGACFADKRKFGACKACVVEINKKHCYASRKKPKKGMNVMVNREDLNALRKERLEIYKEKVKQKNK